MFKKFIKTIFGIAILVITLYVFNQVSGGKLQIFYDQYLSFYFPSLPCQKPIVYNLGTFDSRFGINKKDFLEAVTEAEKVWENAMGKEFFTYNQNASANSLKINLIYDYRQQATEKIKNLGLVVNDTRASYDTLKAKYTAMQSIYKDAQAAYTLQSTIFKNKQNAYETEVNYWNNQGGAPKDVYDRLSAEGVALQDKLDALRKAEVDLNIQVGNINALVVVVNNLAKTLNLNVVELNNIGASRGEEFTEGEYKISGEIQEINIYEFSTKEKLVRVLAHELGHALGLGHVNDPNAIMYRLNESKNGKLTAEDITALKTVCQIK